MRRTTKIGNDQNGIEFRAYDDGTLDEVVVKVGGEVIVHVEQMDKNYFWMGLYVGPHSAHVHFAAKRANVTCRGEFDA